MRKVIKKIMFVPSMINLYLIDKGGNFNYVFVFGYLGFVKYKFSKIAPMGVRYGMVKLAGKKRIFNTYLKLLFNFYRWTQIVSKKTLILHGVGFKYRLFKNCLYLVLGYSHIIKFYFPRDIRLLLIKNKILHMYTFNTNLLNNYVYRLKKLKKLNIYKAKGILLKNEKVVKKEGKKATF